MARLGQVWYGNWGLDVDNLFSILGSIVAFVAVIIAFWQVRRTIVAVQQTNALPVVTNLFNEFRSDRFQQYIEVVLTAAPDKSHWPAKSSWPPGFDNPGFGGSLKKEPDQWRWSALQVAYFFEYLGILIAYKLIPEEIVVDATANSVARTWAILEPFVRAERARRVELNAGNDAVSTGFVRHYEHLVALTSVDGRPADEAIHRRLDLKSVERDDGGSSAAAT